MPRDTASHRGRPTLSDFWKTIVAVFIGGLLTIGANFLTTRWTAEARRRQFLLERSQAFSEFLSLSYLPRSGSVPPECQPRLEECRRERQAAIQTYLFLPTKIQSQLVRSYGATATAVVSRTGVKDLAPEAAAFDDMLQSTREWFTGEKDRDFNFILRCANWTLEEQQCVKKRRPIVPRDAS
jgi:ASC-1-like (ASCH) protein